MTDTSAPGGAPRVAIRKTRAEDIPRTAQLQVELLPHGLFPRLGPAFVRRWHSTFLHDPHAVALVAENGVGEVIGFLYGATDQARHLRSVLSRHRRSLLLAGAAGLLARPGLALHFLRTRAAAYARRLFARGRPASAERRDEPVAVITAVAVHPSARGAGAGAALVTIFCSSAARAGTRRAELVTRADAGGASGFYTRLGWTSLGEHRTRDGIVVRRFRTELSADPAPPTSAQASPPSSPPSGGAPTEPPSVRRTAV